MLTPRAVALLKERFPKAGDIVHEGMTRRELAALLTVEEVARSVRQRMAEPSPS